MSAIASAVVCAVKFVNSFARWLKSIRIFSHILLLVYVLFCPKRNNFTSNFIEIRSIFLRRERNNICHGTEHGTEVATDKTENILSNWAEFIGYWSAKKLILNSRFWSLKIFLGFYRAMLCISRTMLSQDVRLPHAGIQSKWLMCHQTVFTVG